MITRLAQIGWEQGIQESPDNSPGTSLINSVSSTKARTGNYSLAINASSGRQTSTGINIPTTDQVRAFTAVNHNGVESSTNVIDRQVYFFYLLRSDGSALRFGWHYFNSLYYVTTTSTTVLASAPDSVGGIHLTDVWHEIAIDVKIASTGGWAYMYVNGVPVIEFTGNTGTASIVGVLVGGSGTTNGRWSATAYFDDFYVEDTTGETAPSMAEPRFFHYLPVNADDTASQWSGNDGNKTDNYALLDEVGMNDEDATYVYAEEDGLVDLYTHEPLSLPLDQVPVAIIPSVSARKTNAVIDSKLAIRLNKDSDNDDTSMLSLTTVYHYYSQRFTTLPDASELNESNINSTKIGIISGGDYE